VIAALADYDVICVHIEAPDEASHAADAKTKVAAIEAIDQYVVGPIHEAMARDYAKGYRILYLPDHYTSVATRKHVPIPPPFAICGTQVTGVLRRPFSEANAQASDLQVKYGHELMEFFLSSGLK
jgi:2,3-bisphosphoglycerate-independent phosphoglycerate mutase